MRQLGIFTSLDINMIST